MIVSILISPMPTTMAALLAIFALGCVLRPLNTAAQTRRWLVVATAALAVSAGTFGLFASADRLTAEEARSPQGKLRASSGILVDCATGDHYVSTAAGPLPRIGTGGQPIRGGDLALQACG